MTALLSKGNIGLFLTILTECRAMKKLLTLILSALLLCPILAGAQTTTNPTISGPLHFIGYMALISTIVSNGGCSSVTDIRLNIESPNNSTPIKNTNGYFTCTGGTWSPFFGTLVATSGIAPNTTNATTTGYTGNFNLGFTQMLCYFNGNLTIANCNVFVSNNLPTPNTSPPNLLGSGDFIYTSAP